MDTKKKECTKENEGVGAAQTSNIEKLARYIGSKKNSNKITKLLCGTSPEIYVEKIHQTNAKF